MPVGPPLSGTFPVRRLCVPSTPLRAFKIEPVKRRKRYARLRWQTDGKPATNVMDLSSRPVVPLSSSAWYRSLIRPHRLLLESLPVSESVSRLRAEGKITAEMTSVSICFGNIELKREVRLAHRHFPNGGSWFIFSVPAMRRGRCRHCQAQRWPANVLVLLRQLPSHLVRFAGAAEQQRGNERIEELGKLINSGPARLNPRPRRVLDRRMWLTFALRRAKIVKRWQMLRDLRAGKLPR